MKILLPKNEFLEKLEMASRFTSLKLSSATSLQGRLSDWGRKKYSFLLNRFKLLFSLNS